MLNQIVLVGRVQDLKQEQETVTMTIEVKRHYKNTNGEYESDILPIQLYKGIAKNTSEYVKNGDVVGIKGKVQSTENKIEIIAERVTFLSTRKEDEE